MRGDAGDAVRGGGGVGLHGWGLSRWCSARDDEDEVKEWGAVLTRKSGSLCVFLEGGAVRYPVACGCEGPRESGGGGASWLPAKPISFLRHCSSGCAARRATFPLLGLGFGRLGVVALNVGWVGKADGAAVFSSPGAVGAGGKGLANRTVARAGLPPAADDDEY